MALGYTRQQGLQAFDTSDMSFQLITPAKAKRFIDSGELKGVKWVSNPETGGIEFIPDKENWGLTNFMVLSGMTYRLLYENYENTIQNTVFSVVKQIRSSEGTKYMIVSNTCQRIELSEEQLLGLLEINEVGGIAKSENGEIHLFEGVIIEDKQGESKTITKISETNVKSNSKKTPKSSKNKKN